MSEQVTAPNLTDEEFVTEYIRRAQEGTVADADAWVREIFEGDAPVEFVQRVLPLVTSAMQEAGLVPTPVVEDDSDATESQPEADAEA